MDGDRREISHKRKCETQETIFGRSVRASEDMHVTPDLLNQTSSVRVRSGMAVYREKIYDRGFD